MGTCALFTTAPFREPVVRSACPLPHHSAMTLVGCVYLRPDLLESYLLQLKQEDGAGRSEENKLEMGGVCIFFYLFIFLELAREEISQTFHPMETSLAATLHLKGPIPVCSGTARRR